MITINYNLKEIINKQIKKILKFSNPDNIIQKLS